MKKKLLTMLLATTMVFGLVACGGNKANDDKNSGKSGKSDKYELALVTDMGSIDDKSFNQGAWEGVVQYAEENDIAHQYYKPVEQSDEAYKDAIALAVKGGAKTVVCPGYLFEVPVFEMQTQYPDVKFIIIDGAPHEDKEGAQPDIKENTLSIFYAEQQAGYLAGYAAVKDGYKNLGFMGGVAVPAVKRYGYGFVKGAEDAANELGLKDGEVTVRYTYVNGFAATPEINTQASSWYKDGAELIFAAAGGAGNSVMKAAETAKAQVIGVDVDQAAESKTVISSAMKNLKKSVYDALGTIYDNKFEGGQSITLDASKEGVELPMASSKWSNFKQADYDAIYAKLAANEIEIPTDATTDDATGLTKACKLTKVKLTVE
ncbi:MAG: BMP family ABC transporter substrate-binding protein [Lachnospiraceae bacterium]|jgi:basic membrane protein A|nr:BMP family ABC transporter substrate-binding protein [Lachnospiraceae bacterium]